VTDLHPARAALKSAKRVVVKVGSALLADDGNEDPFARFAHGVAALLDAGRDVVMVSSGAIALGWPILGYKERPKDLPGLQASAAAGQGRLISRWERAFAPHGRHVAQVLITHGDLASRKRYINARHAVGRLLERGAIPVFNENDTVAVDEIRFGDNDVLAGSITDLVGADLLVLLTGADGFYAADPSVDPTATRIPVIETIDAELWSAAGPAALHGTGGMKTKLKAAETARTLGATTVIAPGRSPDVLTRVLAGEDIGTLVVAAPDGTLGARKRWIKNQLRPLGRIFVDAGAARALRGGASLLFAGVRGVEGEFAVGDPVDVVLEGGEGGAIARGLSALASGDARKVAGLRTDVARATLDVPLPDELIHRDDLVVLEAG